MKRVHKTSFEEEQRKKDEEFLLTPMERLHQAYLIRERMRKPAVNYSYMGMKVTKRKPD
jgi:hypothetical protein